MKFKPGSYGAIAQRDLDTARDLVEIHPSASLFHAQQALEKIFKQYVLFVGYNPRDPVMRTHNLRKLARAAKVPAVDDHMDTLYELTDAYFNSRYPGEDFYDAEVQDAHALYQATLAVWDILCEEMEEK